MRLGVKNAKVYDAAARAFRTGGLVAENGTILSLDAPDDGVDFGGDLLIPGLIDVHTHGRGGFDYNTAALEEMKAMKTLYAKQGVTTVVPTLASDTPENMLAAVRRVREAGYAAVHIEGRYLSPARRGAHKADLLAPLNADEVSLFAEAAEGMHLHISASYECDPDGSFLAAVLACGATAGLAHTNASYEEASDAVRRGVTSFTHLFNTMPPLHHRAGGAIAAGLLSEAYTELICDGLHLAPETVALAARVKDPSKIVLITDSMEGTGCEDGNYHIAGNPVVLKAGRAYTEDGALAGSTLELLRGVKNFAAFTDCTFGQALIGATLNPAKMLGFADRGQICPGYRGDFLRLSEDGVLKEVYIEGERL